MTPFYIGQNDTKSAYIVGEEARHCVKVMRKKSGDHVVGVDGKGNMLVGKIVDIKKQLVELQILERHAEWGEKSQQIHLLVSPLHKADRFEWLVEKATELGVTHIVPYLSKHTVKTGLRAERLERIMISAMKQCLRSRVPALSELQSLDEAIAACNSEVRLIGHGPSGQAFTEQGPALAVAQDITILIGPEGDFSEDELETALTAGFAPVSLGENRLRSETAAIHMMGLVKHFAGY